MSRIIDGNAHRSIKFFRDKPAALSVLLVYVSRANNDNVAWPSVRGLARDTGWGTNACMDGRQWLVQHKALDRVEEYVRPQWRDLPKDELALRINLDKAEYYRASGIIEVDGKSYPVLYVPVNQESDNPLDVLSHPTSAASDVGPDNTELNISNLKHDQSKKTEPAASSGSASSKFGYTIGDHAYWVEEHPRTYRTTIHEVEIVRFTKAMVEVTYWNEGAQHTVLRKPSSLAKTPPKLERKTTPMQDAIGLHVHSVPVDAPIGKQLAIRLGEWEAEIMTVYPRITPEHLAAAFAWKGEFKPGKVDTVIKMLGEYRDHLATHRNEGRTQSETAAQKTLALLNGE